MKEYDIVIVGAGAAGLICACRLSERMPDCKILMIDRMNKVGKKILATGNGRCNLSNAQIVREKYHSTNPHFIDSVIEGSNRQAILPYFDELGLKTKRIEDGIYPITGEAASVLDVLRLKIEEALNVDVLLNTEAEKVEKKEKYFIHTKTGVFCAATLIMATGGCSAPIYGSNGSGYGLLEALGHTKKETYKALVQLIADKPNLKRIDGVRAKAKVRIEVNGVPSEEEMGEVQFTRYGLSGICILNLSHIASYHTEVMKNRVVICLDLMQNRMEEELFAELIKRRQRFGNRQLENYLTGLLNQKLALFLYQELKVDPKRKISSLSESEIEGIGKKLKSSEFPIIGTKGFDHAQVTAGGMDTKEIDPATFESKLHKNLYILGELLDLYGDCGGYNLNFAFMSGLAAADHIGEEHDSNK